MWAKYLFWFVNKPKIYSKDILKVLNKSNISNYNDEVDS
jgi:hypothetical protein